METTFEESEYIDELTLNTLKSCVKKTMQITGTTTSCDAMSRLEWIERMINKRAEELKFSHVGGLGEKLESILYKHAKRESSYEEFRRDALSLIRSIEIILQHGIIPEDDPESERIRVVHYTIAGAYKAMQQWEPSNSIPF